jgi:hypothetical protein
MSRETQASHSASRKKSGSVPPGVRPALAFTVMSAVVCWFWLASGRVDAARPATPEVSDLAEVTDSDIAGALTTMVSSPTLAQYRERKDGQCRQPLAWVTLVSPQGEPPSHIRLISGTYASPTYDVSSKPIRVAIPFPAPYETGHGVLTAMDAGGATAVSLLPTWRVSARQGKTTRLVTWTPVKVCGRNG